MHPSLHIPDGFLAPEVSIALWVATAVVIGIALRRIATERTNAPARTVLMGIAGAFIFAAQMFNFPVAAGTSGHLLGVVTAVVVYEHQFPGQTSGQLQSFEGPQRPLE